MNSFGLDEPHRDSIGITIEVGIMKLLPAVKLLGVNDDQQFGRFPVGLHESVDVVGVPTVEPFEYDLMHLLGIRHGDVWIRTEGVELPPVLLLRDCWRA